ncbi:MAG: hypothetical protein M1832_006270 [Thelocarpon impressellum]|nr:MAG: hypothetical protein M1832_006270 [Thelocarpon impressellum]
MKLTHILPIFFVPLVRSECDPDKEYIFSNPPLDCDLGIPTVHESAVLARRILTLTSIGTISTVFPENTSSEEWGPPDSVAGTAIGLPEYIADCHGPTYDRGDPTILAITIATSFKNAAAGSNVSLSLRWEPSYPHHHTPAGLPRFSLTGYLETIPADEAEALGVPACFARAHRDAVAWFPGNDIHESAWTRLVVREVFWFGGFGDRAYIGWIPAAEWGGVTRAEIDDARLPGEAEYEAWYGYERAGEWDERDERDETETCYWDSTELALMRYLGFLALGVFIGRRRRRYVPVRLPKDLSPPTG